MIQKTKPTRRIHFLVRLYSSGRFRSSQSQPFPIPVEAANASVGMTVPRISPRIGWAVPMVLLTRGRGDGKGAGLPDRLGRRVGRCGEWEGGQVGITAATGSIAGGEVFTTCYFTHRLIKFL